MALDDDSTDNIDSTDRPGAAGPGTTLERATRALRAEPTPIDPGRIDVTAAVMSRVRGLVRPGRELVVHGPDGSPVHDPFGSQVRVAERVLRTAVRQVATSADTAPDQVRVDVTDGPEGAGTGTAGAAQQVALEVQLVARYGTQLPAACATLRAELLELLDALLGPATTPRRVDLEVVDVTEGDPAEG